MSSHPRGERAEVLSYLQGNDLHRAARELLSILDEEAVSVFSASPRAVLRTVDSLLPPGLEDRVDLCLRSRRRKDPSSALTDAPRASSLAAVNRAVSMCGYEGGDVHRPTPELLRCVVDRVEYLLRAESKGLDYAQVMSDVDFALKSGGLTGKVKARQMYLRAFCLVRLGRGEEALACLDEAAQGGSGSASEQISMMMFLSAADKLRKTIRDRKEKGEEVEDFLPFPKVVEDPNEDFTAFSSSLELVREPGGGSKVTATRDVHACEVVAVDRAAAASLLHKSEEESLSHCSQCLVFTKTPLPCPHCCDVMFCSTACLLQGLRGFHSFECPIGLSCLVRTWTKDPAYSLSLVAIRSLVEEKKLPVEKVRREDLGEEGKEYLRAYFSVLAVSWIRILRRGGFVPSGGGGGDIMFNVSLFTDLVDSLEAAWGPRATHILDPVFKCAHPGVEVELEPVGAGFFPAVDLVRQGCVQNVIRVFRGDTVALVATRNIRKGEEILLNRLYNLNLSPEARAKVLEKGPLASLGKHDKRSCRACAENWPPEFAVPDCLDSDEDLLSYLDKDWAAMAAQAQMLPRSWLEVVQQKSSCLELLTEDRDLYLLHGATNGEVLRCCLYAYGMLRFDPACV